MSGVTLSGVKKSYGDQQVIHGVDLKIELGEFMVFVGPSGCGKSTLLRMIAGLEEISDGDISIDGARINDEPPAKRGVAMVFQNYALYPHMTVAENMGFALKLSGMDKKAVQQAVGNAAEILRITELLERKPKELSGGQRQRVAIGRAIVRKPKVFLFDEPLSNLDAELRVQMRLELSQLHQELGTTMIYVTHDQVEAMTLGQRIAVFNQGRIEQVGTPLELYVRPKNRFVAGFLGSPRMNFIKCQIVDPSVSNAQIEFAGGWRAEMPWPMHEQSGDPVTHFGIRPEHLQIENAPGGLRGKVELLENLGDVVIAYFRVAGAEQPISVKLTVEAGTALRVGDDMALRPMLQHGVLVTAGGAALLSPV